LDLTLPFRRAVEAAEAVHGVRRRALGHREAEPKLLDLSRGQVADQTSAACRDDRDIGEGTGRAIRHFAVDLAVTAAPRDAEGRDVVDDGIGANGLEPERRDLEAAQPSRLTLLDVVAAPLVGLVERPYRGQQRVPVDRDVICLARR
jgi:hypothetical protein